MKTLFCLYFVLFTQVVLSRSVVPDRIVTPNLDIFNKSNRVLKNGDIEVRVATFNEQGNFTKAGKKIVIKKDQFEAFKNKALSVFEMIPNGSDRSQDWRRGTAFSIGENLVLTNNHVLDINFKNTTKCADFQVKDHNGDKFSCKAVHYCNPQHDFCLIEMNVLTKTKRDCLLCEGTKYTVSLADGPHLKLKALYSPEASKRDQEILTAIGNTAGLGIHLSEGRGLSLKNEQLLFFAPITKGNSGGALLNDENLVVGIVKLQSRKTIGSDPLSTYNIAAPTDLVIRLTREALQSHPEILEKFDRSVVE